jgi:PAS domain S-box-containing protein
MNTALQLFAHAGDGVFAIDTKQHIFFWSPLAQQILGYSVEEAVGEYCWKLLDGKSICGAQICSENCSIFQRVCNDMPITPFDLIVKTHSGKRIKINISSIGLPHNGHEIAGLVHIHRQV